MEKETCEMSGRRCLGMELDPKFATMTVNRWQNFTGKQAKKLPTN